MPPAMTPALKESVIVKSSSKCAIRIACGGHLFERIFVYVENMTTFLATRMELANHFHCLAYLVIAVIVEIPAFFL